MSHEEEQWKYSINHDLIHRHTHTAASQLTVFRAEIHFLLPAAPRRRQLLCPSMRISLFHHSKTRFLLPFESSLLPVPLTHSTVPTDRRAWNEIRKFTALAGLLCLDGTSESSCKLGRKIQLTLFIFVLSLSSESHSVPATDDDIRRRPGWKKSEKLLCIYEAFLFCAPLEIDKSEKRNDDGW